MINNEKRYFLKNSNLLEEIHNSKLTYCCYDNDLYKNYDIICDSYEMITPNSIDEFFKSNENRDYIVIRIMTDEHITPYYQSKTGKLNLQDLKMNPFKHYVLSKKDFQIVYKKTNDNVDKIDEINKKIFDLKELMKENNKQIRFNKLNKEAQIPFKDSNNKCSTKIKEYVSEIKELSIIFSTSIRKKMKEVLRSHWKGDTIESGEFCYEQGHLTDPLVHMIMMLVDQFARSGNFSGYTYIQDMKSAGYLQLVENVLKFEESKSSNAFAYLTQVASMKFTSTLNSEKTQRKLKSTMLQELGYDATYGEQAEIEYNYSSQLWNQDNH